MRSGKDQVFSDLCDRVGRGKIDDADEKFLQSRIKTTEKWESFNNCYNK